MSLTSRACLATYGLAALFTTLSARLYYLAGPRHEYYSKLAQSTYEEKQILPARRGAILDIHGSVLARNQPLRDIIIDDTVLAEYDEKTKRAKPVDRAKVAALLAPFLGEIIEPDGRQRPVTEADVLKRIVKDRRYCVIKRKIPEDNWTQLAAILEKAKIRGVTSAQNFDRVYPAGKLLCHVVGFYGCETKIDPITKKEVGRDFKGIDGIERSMENWLAGQEGWRYYQKNGSGKEVASDSSEERAPRQGSNVRLTVDLNIQQIVEEELEKACRELRPKKATVIIMDPTTGAILAMANRPCYDPNLPGEAKPEMRDNHAVASFYEPGSTFKAISAAGVLNTPDLHTTLDSKIF